MLLLETDKQVKPTWVPVSQGMTKTGQCRVYIVNSQVRKGKPGDPHKCYKLTEAV